MDKLKFRLKSIITLSPFGRVRSVSGTLVAEERFDWKNALVDGFIIAMISFFTTLGGVTAAGANVTTVLVSSTISAVAQFFVLLAVKRGIKTSANG